MAKNVWTPENIKEMMLSYPPEKEAALQEYIAAGKRYEEVCAKIERERKVRA